jgi:methionyl-tRNA formyltransferase
MKILFLGDGDWATAALRALMLKHEIVGVVFRCQPTTERFTHFVSQFSLPQFTPSRVNSVSFREQVDRLQPDLCVSVSYDQIIGSRLLKQPRLGFVNLHAAPLPLFRGRATVIWQIINGVSNLGLTTHWMSGKVDQGAIILQKQIPLEADETLAEAQHKLIEEVPDLMLETVSQIETSGRKSTCASDSILRQGSSFPRRYPGDEFIDWRDTSQNIHNKIRALSEPGLYAAVYTPDNGVIRVMRSRLLPDSPAAIGIPGSIIERSKTGVVVKTGDTALELTAISVSNHEAVPAWPISSRLFSHEEARLIAMEQQVADLTRKLRQYEIHEHEELCR